MTARKAKTSKKPRQSKCPRCSRLSERLARGNDFPGRVGQWFEEHPESRLDLEVWVDMAAKGETAVGVTEMHSRLRESGFLTTDLTNFIRWLQKQYGIEKYRLLVSGSRSARLGR